MSVVKVRRARSGTGGVVSSVTIPKGLADDLAAAGIVAFEVELTDDGVLLRPVAGGRASSAARPAWLEPSASADGDSGETGGNSRRATRADKARTATA